MLVCKYAYRQALSGQCKITLHKNNNKYIEKLFNPLLTNEK